MLILVDGRLSTLLGHARRHSERLVRGDCGHGAAIQELTLSAIQSVSTTSHLARCGRSRECKRPATPRKKQDRTDSRDGRTSRHSQLLPAPFSIAVTDRTDDARRESGQQQFGLV
jgi:hypothetical protein